MGIASKSATEPNYNLTYLAKHWRTWSFILLTLCLVFFICKKLYEVLEANEFSFLDGLIFALAFPSLVSIAISFCQALVAFVLNIAVKNPLEVACPILKLAKNNYSIKSKTAIVVPVYNEDLFKVSQRLGILLDQLKPYSKLFEVFILSDTRDIAACAKEKTIVGRMRVKYGPSLNIRYRRRKENTGRKAGNIMEFCKRWGTQFEQMLVLDADSTMRSDTVIQLVKIMDQSPQIGILQTTCLVRSAKTPFSKMARMGHELAGNLLSTGACFWQQGSANYFGHNALIRLLPFLEYCQLPILPGSGPLSGEILSHDFVEAAFIRRAGFEVWSIPTYEGSYEEMPQNIVDYIKRDFRWCQGNFQHGKLLMQKNLHISSRFHFTMGISSYLSNLLWLFLIIISLYRYSYTAIVGQKYFTTDYQLFPTWPEVKTSEALALFIGTMILLATPKIFGAVLVLSSNSEVKKYGGRLRLLINLFLELVTSSLMAPTTMIYLSRFIFRLLSGKGVAWTTQQRDPKGLRISEAIFSLKYQLLTCAIFASLIFYLVPEQIGWFAPIVLGLFLSPLLVSLGSREDLGELLERNKIFISSEEV